MRHGRRFGQGRWAQNALIGVLGLGILSPAVIIAAVDGAPNRQCEVIASSLADSNSLGHAQGSWSLAALGIAVMVNLFFVFRLRRTLNDQRVISRKLQSELDEARAHSRSDQRFVAYLAHETRNLISAVQGTLTLLSQQGSSKPQASILGALDGLAAGLNAMLTVSLDSARIAEGKFEPRKTESDMSQMVRDVARDFAGLAALKGLRIEVSTPVAPLVWLVDDVRTSQILRNLVSNAVKFSHRGVVAVTLAQVDEKQVRVDVVDQGRGISAREAKLLFSEYAQGELSTTQVGSGLGLAMSRVIARRLGCELTFAHGNGGGSRFSLLLNRDEDGQVLSASTLPEADGAAKGRCRRRRWAEYLQTRFLLVVPSRYRCGARR